MYFRFGAASRFSLDFDAAQAQAVDEFELRFEERLNEGWGGFTGTLVARRKAEPEGVHPHYVVQPFSIRLLYNGSRWPEAIDFELSVDELGSANQPEYVISEDALGLFEYLGLSAPEPVPVIPIVHQAAQKLHACTLPDSERAHDLVDLQLMLRRSDVDLAELAAVTVRLFALRGTHDWPLRLQPTEAWESLYQAALADMDLSGAAAEVVARSLEEAVAWANGILVELDPRRNA